MYVNLNEEQRVRLELICMHAGKPTAQVLLDAADHLLAPDVQTSQPFLKDLCADGTQNFLTSRDLEARFARMLRR